MRILINKKMLAALFLTIIFIAILSRSTWADVSSPDQYPLSNSINIQPENDFAAVIMGLPLIWHNADFGANLLGLTGSGQVIGVADTGLGVGNLDLLHPDLKGRIVGVKDYSGDGWDDPHGHGTHIVGSIVGSGEQAGWRLSGMAPDARVFFQAAHQRATNNMQLPGMAELLADAYDGAGVRIHSNSWGLAGNEGIYDHHAQQLDRFVWQRLNMLVLKSAGNFVPGVANQYVSSPGSAKNALVIGATESPRGIDADSDNQYQVAAFSRRGTIDGRIKPDLVAPGTWVLSLSDAHDSAGHLVNYAYLSGTSMANALVTGVAAVTRQYFTDILGIEPSAALLKATLIHGAQELPGESRRAQGFGRVDLQASLMALEDVGTSYQDDLFIKNNQKQRFSVTTAGETPLRITLVWSDYPGQLGADKALVNNLDLKLTAPDGRTLWGNNVIGGDSRNNVEVITVNNPQAGEYLIDVKGTGIVQRGQTFSIIYGDLPLRGTVREAVYDQDIAIEAPDGSNLEIDATVSVRLMINNQLERKVPLSSLPPGANIYYLPTGDQRTAPKVAAIYDTAYATLNSRLPGRVPVIYSDIAGHWAEEVIANLSEWRIVGGYPDGSFRPDQPVTRAQFAAMLVRALKLAETPRDKPAGFVDVPTGAWHHRAVSTAVEAGLVAGYSEHFFRPNEAITREQMAAMVSRALGGETVYYSPENQILAGYIDQQEISAWARPSVSLMVKHEIMKGRAENKITPQGITTRAEATAVLLRMFDLL